jgi:hypothetical protein
MRSAIFGTLPFLCAVLSPVGAQERDAHAEHERARCASVEVLESADFRGLTLIEIPDVTAPQMRLANMLLSSRCLEEATALLEEYVLANGADAQSGYVITRLTWTLSSDAAAEQAISDLIEEYPSFVSGHVLLAGFRIGQYKFPEATAILDEVAPRAPADLWVFLDRLRVEALTQPSDAVAQTLLAILNDPQFPPNARLTAADAVQHMKNVSLQDFEAAYKGIITVGGPAAACTVPEYAIWLSEGRDRVADARELLEKHVAGHERCSNYALARMLLAYTYLVAAAELGSSVNAANAAWVQRADALLEGDYTRLASWLVGRPRESKLRPFVVGSLPTDAVDRYGHTQICNGVIALNADTVRAELERGADPNGQCDDGSLVRRVLLMITLGRIAERQAVIKVLLDHGARPADVQGCAGPYSGDCETVLLPILYAYGFGE